MKKLISILLCVFIFSSLVSVTAFADEDAPFTVSGAIGNDMVLQRQTDVSIWGWSDKKGEKITVSFKGNTTETTVDENGEWLALLPPMEADKTENELTVSMGDYTETFTGIVVGDVYLVAGQSNAEKTLASCSIYKTNQIKEWIDEVPDMIRYFMQTKSDATSNNGKFMAEPQKDTILKNKWKKESASTAKSFSAIGFFFAHKVAKEADIPIGMINVSTGGSPVSQIMSKEASDKTNYTRFENNIPVSGMYNALMAPFINTAIKGMIYYQGESEMALAKSNYGKYNEYVNAYVEDLREKMGQDFPFYYVQLSSHATDKWDGINEQRAVQFEGLKVIKNSGMVVSMDHGIREGDADFAHPNYKKPVGDRLGALALCRDYGIGDENYVTSPMPLYAYKSDDGVVIKFENVGDGLKVIGQHETLSGFKVMLPGSSRGVEAKVLEKDTVLLPIGDLTRLATGVGYGLAALAFADYPEGDGDLTYVANLGNSSDLPAPTFKLHKIYESEADAISAIEAENATPTPEVTASPEATDNIDKTPNDTKDFPIVPIIIIAVAVVVAIVAVAVVVIAKKKK